jgi:ribosomal protein S12 methylthiotransferase
MRVLVDASDGNTAIARSEGDAPEIDGTVRIALSGKNRAAKLPVGEFVEVEITGSGDHDLEAKLVKAG